jgi:hypothetical protein
MTPTQPNLPDASIAEATRAFLDGCTIFFQGTFTSDIYILARMSYWNSEDQFGFLCVTDPTSGPCLVRPTLTGTITHAMVNYDLFIAESLSTVLNAYDL